MRVFIKGQVVNYQVTSVWLTPDVNDPHNMRLKMFFCPNCRTPILQYKGFITKIIPGELPVDLPIVIKCPNTECNQRYSVQGITELSSDTMRSINR